MAFKMTTSSDMTWCGIGLLLHGGSNTAAAATNGLNALLETAAAAAAAENDHGASKQGAIAELKQELREDADLASIGAAAFFLDLTSI